MGRTGKWARVLLIYLSLLAMTLLLVVERSPARDEEAVPAMSQPAPGGDSPRRRAQPPGFPLDGGFFQALLRMGLPLLDAYPADAGTLSPWQRVPLMDLLSWLSADFRAFRLRTLLQISVPALALSEPEHRGASEEGARGGAAEWPLPGGVPAPTPRGAGEPEAGLLRPLEPAGPPRVIVYSTHAHEAFLPTLAANGIKTASPYTDNPNLSIVRVAGELARTLQEEHGIPAVHLSDIFDVNGLTGAYMESLKGVEEAMKRYPTARVLLDIHRDSSDRSPTVTVIIGQTVSRVLFVVGKGNDHLPNPHWQENRAFGDAIASALDAAFMPDPTDGGRRYPPLVRQLNDGDGDPLTFSRNGRFNQHLSPAAMLIEIGGPYNTLEEGLRTARMLARAVAEVLRSGAR